MSVQGLRDSNVKTGLVSNTDTRMSTSHLFYILFCSYAYSAGSVIADLGIASYLDPVILSEEEGIEKPSLQIFLRACQRAGVERDEVLHVGDELKA
jgi:beta-phosphoglucomutase-like phosphatase (HAD superfamily)